MKCDLMVTHIDFCSSRTKNVISSVLHSALGISFVTAEKHHRNYANISNCLNLIF